VTAELLAQPHLSVITRDPDRELGEIRSVLAHKVLVDGRAELEAELGRLLAQDVAPTPKTLDLIGHTTSDRSLLVLGDWVIDATSPTVTSFFRGLADQNVLERLGIRAVRLLGCNSADSAHGRWTICRLTDVLGVEVLGTTGLMLASYYTAGGLDPARRYLLTSSSELRDKVVDPRPLDRGTRATRELDLDGLPAQALPARRAWPIRLADRDDARAILRLVRRRDGSELPGLVAAPACEVAFPAASAGTYHLVQVLLDGEIVRVYPAGETGTALVYPVDDPHELKRVLALLPDAR
jgi:hypothetical protein